MNKRCLLILIVISATSPALTQADESRIKTGTPTISRPLSPPSEQAANSQDDTHARAGSFVTTLGALGLILMIFLGLVQMWKKRSPQSFLKLPEDAWQELGSTRLDHRYQVRLVRVGSRILVLGQSDTNLQTLSEITETEEVANLVALCGEKPGDGQKSRFHSLYEQFRSRIDARETACPAPHPLASRESNSE